MQATPAFMAANEHVLVDEIVQDPLTGIMVNGAQLLPAFRNPKECPDAIEILFETDCDDLVETLEPGAIVAADTPALALITSRRAFIEALVEEIHNCHQVPMYRGRPAGSPVLGWPNRLKSYFWPTPATGYRSTVELTNILAEANRLASATAVGLWNPLDQAASVDLANRIFAWGGVPQVPAIVTPAVIRSVFDTAIAAETPIVGPMPPMNSGWTKVAAFASAHLEGIPNHHPQVIWDSRVATSILSRLDGLLAATGVTAIPTDFVNIGRVDIGRGGTRPRALTLPWPNGYRSWPAQLAASTLIAEIRDVLNENPAKYGKMPAIDLSFSPEIKMPWTVRGVEMVLFVDGY